MAAPDPDETRLKPPTVSGSVPRTVAPAVDEPVETADRKGGTLGVENALFHRWGMEREAED